MCTHESEHIISKLGKNEELKENTYSKGIQRNLIT